MTKEIKNDVNKFNQYNELTKYEMLKLRGGDEPPPPPDPPPGGDGG